MSKFEVKVKTEFNMYVMSNNQSQLFVYIYDHQLFVYIFEANVSCLFTLRSGQGP